MKDVKTTILDKLKNLPTRSEVIGGVGEQLTMESDAENVIVSYVSR